MAAAGAVVAAALKAVQSAAVAGVSTLSLDAIAESVIREAGAVPSFLGYHGYPASICSSVNDRVVHGIPSAAEVLVPGDLVSIDCGAVLDGWHGDAAVTFGIGSLIPADEALSQATNPDDFALQVRGISSTSDARWDNFDSTSESDTDPAVLGMKGATSGNKHMASPVGLAGGVSMAPAKSIERHGLPPGGPVSAEKGVSPLSRIAQRAVPSWKRRGSI